MLVRTTMFVPNLIYQKGELQMAKLCPITGERVLYLDCLECDCKPCRNGCKGDSKEERKEDSE